MGWSTVTLYKCIAHTDKEFIECSLAENEEYPEAHDILKHMRDYVTCHTIVNPYEDEEYEEYQIPGQWEATDGKLELYRDEEEYYLMQPKQVMMRDMF